MRKKLLILLLLCFSGIQANTVVRIELDGVILSAKERGNLFQMLGYYVQIASHLNYHYPEENLRKNMQEYEAVLVNLEKHLSPTIIGIDKYLAHSREIWKALKIDLAKGKQGKPDKEKLRHMLALTTALSKDMKKVQTLLIEKSFDPNLKAEVSATADIITASTQLATYYIISVSIDPSVITEAQKQQSMASYLHALELIEKSDLNQANIFHKRFAEIKKVYFFNTMSSRMSKTPIPALVIKKNYQAYLYALVSTKLITAASTEGKKITMAMP